MPSLDDPLVAQDVPEARSATPLKRKRGDEAEPTSAGANGTAAPSSRALQSIQDIWTLVNSHPGASSTNSALQTESSSSSSSSNHTSKRAKLDDEQDGISQTIAERVKDRNYQNLEAFSSDVDDALQKALASVDRTGNLASAKQWKYTPDSTEQDKQAADIKSLIKYFHDLIRRESSVVGTKPPEKIKQEDPESKPMTNGATLNGIKHEHEDKADPQGHNVLTLFGNAQGHKQLYSSFQSLPQTKYTNADEAPRLREEGLPIGISTLTIPSVKAKEAAVQAKRTFVEAFGPPAKLTQLAPPETPKLSFAKGATLTWGPPTPAMKPASSRAQQDKLVYQKQNLPTGAWLGYGGVSATSEPTSAEAKRKQRDRALSTGEAGRLSSDAAIAAQLQAKEEALFRSVYSSFAPSFDNSLAVVPETTKNQIWWEKSGKQFYEEVFAIDPALEDAIVDDDPIEGEDSMELNGEVDEDQKFKEVVDNFEAPSLEPLNINGDETNISAKLQRISELLETIHSHQRIRNSTISSGTHTPISPSPSLQDLRGTPSTPSIAEIEVYNDVKSQLAAIIGSLPPYILSKVHGEQLEDLIISRNIIMESPDIKGVLEEDQNTRLARAAAITAAINTNQGQVRTGANQYGPYTRKVQPTTTGQYNTPSGNAARNAPSFQRQNLSNWQSPAQNYAATVQRPSYANTGYGGYGQQTPRPPNTAPQMRGQPLAHYGQRPGNMQPNGQYTPSSSQHYPSQPGPMGMPNMGSPTKAAPLAQMQSPYNSSYRPPSSGGLGMQQPLSTGGAAQGVNEHALNATSASTPRPQTPAGGANANVSTTNAIPPVQSPQAPAPAPTANMQVQPVTPAPVQQQQQQQPPPPPAPETESQAATQISTSETVTPSQPSEAVASNNESTAISAGSTTADTTEDKTSATAAETTQPETNGTAQDTPSASAAEPAAADASTS